MSSPLRILSSLFSAGGLTGDRVPLVIDGVSEYPDPVPQALVLTAIVIGFAMTALSIVIIIRMRDATGSDHVDGSDAKTRSEGDAS